MAKYGAFIVLSIILFLFTGSIIHSKGISLADTSITNYTVRNIGVEGGEASPINLSSIEDLDLNYLELIDSLLKAAELLKEYNETLSHDLVEVAESLAMMNEADAITLYQEILPSLIDLLSQMADNDPELYVELSSLLPMSIKEYTNVGLSVPLHPSMDITSGKPLITPNLAKVNNMISNLPSVDLTRLMMLAAAILIPIILYFGYVYKEIVGGQVFKPLRRTFRRIYVSFKLGNKPSDPRGIIIYNYRKFLLHMETLGFKKARYETPREFLMRISGDIGERAVELTRLFEYARYTNYNITEDMAEESERIIMSMEGG